METSLPTPMTARVYVNLPEGNTTYKHGDDWGMVYYYCFNHMNVFV